MQKKENFGGEPTKKENFGGNNNQATVNEPVKHEKSGVMLKVFVDYLQSIKVPFEVDEMTTMGELRQILATHFGLEDSAIVVGDWDYRSRVRKDHETIKSINYDKRFSFIMTEVDVIGGM